MASTIKDIARELGISISTVSYALNDGPRPVPADVRARVLDVAERLQYRPNRVARSLKDRRSHVIGIVPTMVRADVAIGPYFVAGLNAVFNVCAEMGQDVLIYTQHSSFDTEEGARRLLDGRADGLVFLAPRIESPVVAYMRRVGFPHVLVNGEPQKGTLTFNVDNRAGMRMAVDHLVAAGHRRIGHLAGGAELYDAVERRMGFEAAMAAHGLPVEPRWTIDAGFDAIEGRKAADDLLSRGDLPSAVVCGNDETASALLTIAGEHGVRVPENLAVTGFDNSAYSQIRPLGITTLAQPITDIAGAATRALLRLIEGSRDGRPLTFSPELIVRGSSLAGFAAPLPS